MAPKQDSEATVAVNVEELRASKDAVRSLPLVFPLQLFSGVSCWCRDFYLPDSLVRALRVAYKQSFVTHATGAH